MRHHVGLMQATDMRSLSREARHERRVHVIRRRKSDLTYDEIAAQTGLSRTGVFDICNRRGADGAAALKGAPGGRQVGDKRLLFAEQEVEVRKLIADKATDQLKLVYALWARQAVAELIRERFGIELSVRTMGLYLSRWGFTQQKPMRRAYEQSPTAEPHATAEVLARTCSYGEKSGKQAHESITYLLTVSVMLISL